MKENVFDEALVSTNSAPSMASVMSLCALQTPLPVFSIEYPPYKDKTWTAAHAEKTCDASVKLRSENLVTNLKNYPHGGLWGGEMQEGWLGAGCAEGRIVDSCGLH